MNLPNSLTIPGIFFVLLEAALVQENVGFRLGIADMTNEWLALSIFLSAAATDLLEGYLARRWRQVTTIGTLPDPIPKCGSGSHHSGPKRAEYEYNPS